MIEHIGLHTLEPAYVIDYVAEMWQKFAQFHTTLAVT
jgi:hypothetical protein